MAVVLPNIVRKMNLFVDGRGHAGQLDEVTPPKLTLKTEDYRPGGLDAPIEMDMGMEKLEIGFVLSGANVAIFRSFGILGSDGLPMTIRGGLQRQGSAEVQAVVFTLRGMFREIDLGTWKPGERNTMTVAGGLTYYKVTIGGDEVIEIDLLNVIRKIDGVDHMAALRASIGL